MEQTKIELPWWLPWATTACLAALVACLGELLFIEKARTRFLRDQGQLAETAMRGAQNQLEAERIVERRAMESLRAGDDSRRALQVLLLSPPDAAAAGAPTLGAIVVDPADGRGLIRLAGGTEQPTARDYQLWLDGPGGGYPANCGVFHGASGADGSLASFAAGAPVSQGCRFLLVDGPKGGARTLGEAQSRGSIVLASLPYSRRIPTP
jgi:hypothetical protein